MQVLVTVLLKLGRWEMAFMSAVTSVLLHLKTLDIGNDGIVVSTG